MNLLTFGMDNFNSAEESISLWKRAETHLLEKYFLHFFDDGSGNNGYPNQWSLPVGINYGTLDQSTKNTIKNASKINMHLAINDNERFCVVFEFIVEGVRYLSDPATSSSNFNINNVATESIVPRYGISPELRNQFVFNWIANVIPFKSLFYSLGTKNPQKSLKQQGNMSWVRAHYYGITGDNLTRFINLMNDDKVDEINLNFGVNFGDILENKDMFTLILELKQGSDVTYLDFVGACPPNCEEV
jgi:hypothetical protein